MKISTRNPTDNSRGGEKNSWVKSRLAFQDILNPDPQDFPNFFLPGNVHYIGKISLQVGYISH